jgi:hypothetical protein
MRFWLGVLFGVLVIEPVVVTETHYEFFVREEQVPWQYDSTPTPVLDSFVDWDRFDQENECLWVFLQDSGLDITLENVIIAGNWTDANGGACFVIGENHEG